MSRYTADVLIGIDGTPPPGSVEEQREWWRQAVSQALSNLDIARKLEGQLEGRLFGTGSSSTVSVRCTVVQVQVLDVDHPDDLTPQSSR